MIGLVVASAVVGPLVVEFLVRTTGVMLLGVHAQELAPFLAQFRLAVGNDHVREKLARQAGWHMLKLGFAALFIICIASAIAGAAPVLMQWPEEKWTQYGIAVSVTASIWWLVRRRFQHATP